MIRPKVIQDNMMKNYYLIAAACLLALLVACGGGSTSSNDQALIDAGENTGIYKGSGSLSLKNEGTGKVVDELATEVIFDTNRNGIISFSDSSGSRGSAQLTNDLRFAFRSDARTQFDGVCQAGLIFLEGFISEGKVSATYRSEGIICSNVNFTVDGSVSAEL